MDVIKHFRWYAVLLAVGVLLVTSGCTVGQPTVVIASPQPGSRFALGEPIVVQTAAVVADEKGIARIELWGDSQLVDTALINPPATSVTIAQSWTPATIGTHIIEVRAYTVDGIRNETTFVVVSVESSLLPGTPAPVGSATPGPPVVGTELPPPSVATSLPSPTPTPTLTPTPQPPQVTVLIQLNVRSGPGTEYPVIGWLPQGSTALVTGRNPEGTWWQIVYPTGSAGRGWVSGRPQYTLASNTEGVPVVIPPPPPPPTATPTFTPVPQRPTIFNFWADRYVVAEDEPVRLYWDLANAEAAYLLYDAERRGVVAPGSIEVRPKRTTTYTLWAYNAAGETSQQLTVYVTPSYPSGIVLDLLAAAPSASWTSSLGAHVLTFGVEGDPRGFVVWRDYPVLEDGSQPARVLQTHPQWVDEGMIVGDYALPRPIVPGDRFRARVGFLSGAHGQVTFVLAVRGGPLSSPVILASVKDSGTDGKLRNMNVDLSPAVGATNIQLGVLAGESSFEDWAVWLEPRVER